MVSKQLQKETAFKLVKGYLLIFMKYCVTYNHEKK